MSNPQPPRTCFILGVLQRSGTNYLYDLLGRHPHCATPGPLWEDFFVRSADLLRDYTEQVRRKWNPRWNVEARIGSLARLRRDFGRAIEDYLHRQLPPAAPGAVPRCLLTKTPSALGAEYFHELFPEARLVLLMRDGRAVVESGVRSFGWDYEAAIHAWKVGARVIDDLCHAAKRDDLPLLLVRYEDLFAAPQRELTRIFAYLGLDAAAYDFTAIEHMALRGSSESRATHAEVHWREERRGAGFDPLHRHARWPQRRRERFHWLAGNELTAFGYEPDAIATDRHGYRLGNRLRDLHWRARVLWQTTQLLRWRWPQFVGELERLNYGRLEP